ncbi:hypothetical protein [Campylobacter sp. CCS1377]|uniref:Uncharacterized protein n=1 Tax=Campylobacter sp. CCS1377 TaxID=3158229 RepID=A0AAU7E5N5_9BACT
MKNKLLKRVLKLCFFTFFIYNTAYALCTDELSDEDLKFIQNTNLNQVNFKCNINNQTYYYNNLTQKEYLQNLEELKAIFNLNKEELKTLSYIIYLNEALFYLKLDLNFFKNFFSAQKNDISNLENLRNSHYKQIENSLTLSQKEELQNSFVLADQILQKNKIAKDYINISSKLIEQSKQENREILNYIENSNKDIFSLKNINQLIFLYNANLLINEAKNYPQRLVLAYDKNEALKLLEILLETMYKIPNKEDKLVLLQSALITYDKAISSLDINLPLNEQKYKKIIKRKEYIILMGRFFQSDAFAYFNTNIKRKFDFKDDFIQIFPKRTSEILKLIAIYNQTKKTLMLTKEALKYKE